MKARPARRSKPRRPFLPLGPPPVGTGADAREVARFLRQQPEPEVPPRRSATTLPGLIGLPILGYRVIRRLE